MRDLLIALCTAPALFGGCFSTVGAGPGSACVPKSADFAWLNAPAQSEAVRRGGRPYYDTAAGDPALANGVKVRGGLEFDLRARGAHLVEVFLVNPEIDRHSFRLEANGKQVDERPLIAPGPGRLRPKRGNRYTSLLAVVDGPARLSVKTEAPEYVLSAVRWTPMAQFESDLAPKYLERARYLQTHILTEGAKESPTARRQYLQQLGDRLYFSSRPEIRREGLLYRMRAWFWLAAENHEPDDLLQTGRLLEEGLRVMPRDSIVRQMASAACTNQVVRVGRMPEGRFCDSAQPVRWPVEVPAAPAGAPEWAVAQRRLMRRMEALTRWWVEKRQAPNGELGGGWGDDVEILRHWGPQALGFGSRVAAQGVLNIAGGLWNSGTLLNGYDRGISDVEHSSEPTTDTLPLSAALQPEDAAVRGRLAATAACAENWIARQPDGFFRFRSTWFNCREADTSPSRAVDVHLNTRAMGPALWHAYLTRDAKLIRLIASWADSWIHAMRETKHGKPAGIFPPVLRSADGSYLVGSSEWNKPDAEWDYFQWNGGSQEAVTSLVLAVYDLTGDKKYLEAAGESFRVLDACAAHADLCGEIRKSPEAFYVWRRATGDARYDRFFEYDPQSPDAAVLAGLTRMARETEERLSLNWDMFTTEVLYTDRVYYPLPPAYRWRLFGGEAPRGDRYPAFTVTWPATDVEFARAVTAASGSALTVRVYSFATAERNVPVRLWRLKPGRYEWRAAARSGSFTVTRLPHTLEVPLPPQKEASVTVRAL
ncbi:MAG: hypothetical protein ACE15B_17010 [Bryobacteraceae bacterium]